MYIKRARSKVYFVQRYTHASVPDERARSDVSMQDRRARIQVA